MKIETYRNIVERQCSLTVRVLMEIMPEKMDYVYILNPMAQTMNSAESITVAIASNNPKCIVHTCNRKRPKLDTEKVKVVQWDSRRAGHWLKMFTMCRCSATKIKLIDILK